MKLYDKNSDRIVDIQTIKTDDGRTVYASKADVGTLIRNGYYKVKIHPKPNERYYVAEKVSELVGGAYEITYTQTEKSVSDVQAVMLQEVKGKQAKALDDIDWYWMRELKTGTPVPENIKELANFIYANAEKKESEILALTTIDEIIEYELG